MTTVALPFEYTTRGRTVARTSDPELVAVLMEGRDRQLEDWIASVWVGGDGLRDGAIGRSKLAVDAIQSTNYDGPDGAEVFADAGSYFNLSTGDIITPGLFVDAAAGTATLRGVVAATGFSLVNSDGDTIATWDDTSSGLWGSDGYLEFTHDTSLATLVTVPGAVTRFGINEAFGNFAGGQIEQVTTNEDADEEQGRAGMKWNGDMSGAFGNYAELISTWQRFSPTGDGVERVASVRATAGRTDAETMVEIDATFVVIDANGTVEDGDGRQFVRSDTARGTPVLIQANDVSTATDASGDITVTFAEEFTSAPHVVVTFANSSTVVNIPVVRSVSTTGFTVRIYNTSAVAIASQTRHIHWAAYGVKDV